MALLLVPGQAALAHGDMHGIPLVTPASHPDQEGFVRIINRSDQRGTVAIHAIDDSGMPFGPIEVELAANETVHFNSTDLEEGNASKGLFGGLGDGDGNWRLELESDLDIEPLGYIRTGTGFVTSMHDLVAEDEPGRYRVPIFNPGSNRMQRSELRLINPGTSRAAITITGFDDRGRSPPGGDVRLTLGARQSRTITAQQLESGGTGLTGSFGDGSGKWILLVFSDESIQVMSILQSADGNLTNLSRTPYVEHEPEEEGCETAGLAPANQEGFDRLVVGKAGTLRFTRGALEGEVLVYNFPTAGNFYSDQIVRVEGRYTYVNTCADTGASTGTLTLDYTSPSFVAGDRCTARLTFETRTSGRVSASCNSPYLGGGEGEGMVVFGPG